ncbi:MAG: phenylalanine--tRNA ligase subunit beta, partial [Clostridia bacterium]|nr:phenylalanine--tRNA ligase subunit beta [Clostridia bacterium]
IDKPVYVAEIDFTQLVSFANKEIFVKTFSKFPAVERDLALVCDRELTHAQILETILSARVKTLTQVKLFDVYTGEHIAPDKKSLAYRLTFSSNEKTFDVEEVENFVRKILIKLDAIGVKLR